MLRIILVSSLVLLTAQGCTQDSESISSAAPSPTAPSTTSGQRVVTVGFWQNASCTGEMIGTTTFPVDFGDTQCLTWSGRSGTNSASRFSCGPETFSYTQWTTLTCSGGQVPEGTRKTVSIGGCIQGVPPQQYGRILDFSGCR